MDESRRQYEEALDRFAEGKHEEAAAILTDLVGRCPDYDDAYEALGMILYRAGRLDEAVEWTERLAARRPDHAMAHANLSVFYMKKGMKERAEEEKAKAAVLRFTKPTP